MNLPFKLIRHSEIENWRAETFWSKEPETISWIQEFIKDGDVVYDVGANIGIYSLYIASLYENSYVYAFEPYDKNYDSIEENLMANKLWNLRPYLLAVSDVNGITDFFIKDDTVGHSGSQIDSPVDESGKQYTPQEVTRIVTITLDDFSKLIRPPKHIKIDVDGVEEKIINGMQQLLGSQGLKSVLIEVNPSTNKDKLIKTFTKHGFTTDNKFNKQENHSSKRRKAEGIKAENIIFTRNK